MNDEIDTPTGGEDLTIDQAAAAYSKAIAPKEVQTDQTKGADEQDGSEQTDDELREGDEPEGEDGDGETGEDDQAGDQQEDETPDTERGRYVAHNGRVKLPDGTESTVSDLIAGNLKNADATKKWQDAAELRKSAEAQSATLKASQEQLEQRERYATQLIQSIIGEPPSPSMLDPNSADFDILGYNQKKANHEAWLQHFQNLQQQDHQSRQKKTEEQTKAERDKADSEWNALLQVKGYDHLKDPKKAETFAKDIGTYLGGLGFTQAEMRAVALDHRMAVTADKARRWDKLQASKPQVQTKVEGRPPVQRGGKRLGPGEHKARAAADAIAKAKQSGRLDDVVAAYSATRKG